MATMLKIKKENGKEVTPQYIKERLFYFSDAAHSFHLETKSFAQHKALSELYEGLITFRDDICELLMGYLGGERIGAVNVGKLPEYTADAPMQLAKDVQDFAYEVYEWAEEKHYCDIENTAQSLSGLSAKTVYLLTLK